MNTWPVMVSEVLGSLIKRRAAFQADLSLDRSVKSVKLVIFLHSEGTEEKRDLWTGTETTDFIGEPQSQCYCSRSAMADMLSKYAVGIASRSPLGPARCTSRFCGAMRVIASCSGCCSDAEG